MTNEPVLDPGATDTEAGTVAAGSVVLSPTTTPPDGAPLVSFAVPVLFLHPATVAGLRPTDDNPTTRVAWLAVLFEVTPSYSAAETLPVLVMVPACVAVVWIVTRAVVPDA